VLRVASEERVVAEVVAGSVGDNKCEGLEPGGATFGLRGEDDVVEPGLEAPLDEQEPLEKPRFVALVLDEWFRPPVSCRECGYESFNAFVGEASGIAQITL
jgi:hypothetical protein